ncbi:MAG: hypothetical protein LBB59_01930 [Campylobacteraceae bacterium]|nr:hypothetical protein [Campylobacteraceae bacterium]
MQKIVFILLFCASAIFAQNIFTTCKESYISGDSYDKCVKGNIDKLAEFEKNSGKKSDEQEKEIKELKKESENLAKSIKKLESETEKLQKEIKELKNDISTLKKR